MNPVRIRIWLKSCEFLETSIDFDDVMAINKAYVKVKDGVIKNENLKITISNITFHFDDIEETMCSYDYPYTEHSISTVTIEERDAIEEELNNIYSKIDDFIKHMEKKYLIVSVMIILVLLAVLTAYQIYSSFSM
nr:MAG TPA: hypothetical protein [Caudoviricetes sp.]